MFADRLCAEVRRRGTPCVVGLDPRIDQMPQFVLRTAGKHDDPIRAAIATFHRIVLDEVGDRVAAVKPQLAFFEQYGLSGLAAFADTVAMAHDHGLLVIADGKRNDIDSTAAAYANAFLGAVDVMGARRPGFDADALTVSPFLGEDSLLPFVQSCAEFGKGIFVLVKTSNRGSADLQDLRTDGEQTVSARVAGWVDRLGTALVGASGYSAVGAVVGATFPDEARALRALMPRAVVLVPGYGAQGASADDAVAVFDAAGMGGLVNASRAITYSHARPDIDETAFRAHVRGRLDDMVAEVAGALARGGRPAS